MTLDPGAVAKFNFKLKKKKIQEFENMIFVVKSLSCGPLRAKMLAVFAYFEPFDHKSFI